MKICKLILMTMLFGISSYCQTNIMASSELSRKVQAELGKQKGVFAVAFKDLATAETMLLNEHALFHAASTMKTPVMIEVFKQVSAGKLSLTDSVVIKNDFTSIADNSTYQLSEADDSELELYKQIGGKTTLYDLVYKMIIMSSNLATNMLIEMVDGKKVTQSMRALGAHDIQVLRGVEDNKAYAKAMNNTVSIHPGKLC